MALVAQARGKLVAAARAEMHGAIRWFDVNGQLNSDHRMLERSLDNPLGFHLNPCSNG